MRLEYILKVRKREPKIDEDGMRISIFNTLASNYMLTGDNYNKDKGTVEGDILKMLTQSRNQVNKYKKTEDEYIIRKEYIEINMNNSKIEDIKQRINEIENLENFLEWDDPFEVDMIKSFQ